MVQVWAPPEATVVPEQPSPVMVKSPLPVMAALATSSGEVVLVLVSVAAMATGVPTWTAANASGLGVSVAVAGGRPVPERLIMYGLPAELLVMTMVADSAAPVVGMNVMLIWQEALPPATVAQLSVSGKSVGFAPVKVIVFVSGALPWL